MSGNLAQGEPTKREDLVLTIPHPERGIGELFGALAKAQGKIEKAKENKENPFYKSKYSDLASCSDACKSQLSEVGIAVIQIPYNGEGFNVGIETILGHQSGQSISGKLESQPKDKTSQAMGSAITYLRRYTLCAMVGITFEDEDDDGNAASGKYPPRTSTAATKQPAKRNTPPKQTKQAKEPPVKNNEGSAYDKHKANVGEQKIYDPTDIEMAQWLEKGLEGYGVPEDQWPAVSAKLEGKPITQAKQVAAEVMKEAVVKGDY